MGTSPKELRVLGLARNGQNGRMWRLVLALALVIPLSAYAGNLRTAPIVAKSGNWTVKQIADAMTDKKSCVALYKSRLDIQVSEDDFYFSLKGKGGVSMITYRVDDERPESRLATDVEKRVDAADISGGDFRHLLGAKRLRIQILTVLSSLVEEDLDLSGIAQAHSAVVACPEQSTPLETGAETKCSDAQTQGMRKLGLSDDQVRRACE